MNEYPFVVAPRLRLISEEIGKHEAYRDAAQETMREEGKILKRLKQMQARGFMYLESNTGSRR